ncbi:unnamed protein product [Rhizophagus irregularis]|nr:unnamed protein product [Rhizophagus irregularis]
MKGAGGLVPGTGNSNKVKWVSESARYASQHHNTNSVQNQNVYRIEVDRQKYEEFRRKCVEKTSLHSKNAKHGSKKGETVSQPPNVWDQQRKRYVGPKRVNQPPPKGKINVGIQHGNIPDFNKLSINGKVKKLSQTAKDNASNWTGI